MITLAVFNHRSTMFIYRQSEETQIFILKRFRCCSAYLSAVRISPSLTKYSPAGGVDVVDMGLI